MILPVVTREKIKKLLIAVLIINSMTMSFTRYGTLSSDDLYQRGGGSFSMISQNGDNVLNLQIDKDFIFNEVKIGGAVNIVFPENKRPPGLSVIEIRYLEYDNGRWGMRFGPIVSETYGYGLIMDGYNSSPVTTYSNMSKSGLKAYTRSFFPLGFYGMYTGTLVVGSRFTYNMLNIMPETPLVVGVSFIQDNDGVLDTNKVIINRGAYGYSADVGFKIIKPWMDAYIEYGVLSNQSTAIALGTKIDGGNLFDFRFEYRMLGTNFIPGLFNANYEVAPSNVASSYPATHGLFFGVEARMTPIGVVSIGYEQYSNRDAVARAAVAFNKINGVSGVVSYEQTLAPLSPHKIIGTFVYPLNAYTNLVTYYEQIGNQEASYTVAYSMNF